MNQSHIDKGKGYKEKDYNDDWKRRLVEKREKAKKKRDKNDFLLWENEILFWEMKFLFTIVSVIVMDRE